MELVTEEALGSLGVLSSVERHSHRYQIGVSAPQVTNFTEILIVGLLRLQNLKEMTSIVYKSLSPSLLLQQSKLLYGKYL